MDAADHVALICIHRSPSGITRDHSGYKSSLIFPCYFEYM
jgi:hypothetical protein